MGWGWISTSEIQVIEYSLTLHPPGNIQITVCVQCVYTCILFLNFSCDISQVFTVEEMMPHIQHLKGAHSKNLFLKDKKKKDYWLVTVLHDRQINLNDLAKQLGVGSGNLRFADETAMLEKLKVGQGCATPLALFCDDGDVKFVLDSAFLEGGHEKVYFHPMTNAATMGLSPEDFLTFVKETGHDPIRLNFDKN